MFTKVKSSVSEDEKFAELEMGDVLPFKRPDLKIRAKGKTLCNSGFHKWKICQKQKFDVKLGKLVTVCRCERCGEEKTKAM
jgi:flagellar motor switch protein FliM